MNLDTVTSKREDVLEEIKVLNDHKNKLINLKKDVKFKIRDHILHYFEKIETIE